jgi:hypothetical protein
MVARSSATRFRTSSQRSGPGFAVALKRMKAGEVLRFAFDKARPAWTLGDEAISAEIVSLLLATREIEADDDTLLPHVPAQAWRLRSVK